MLLERRRRAPQAAARRHRQVGLHRKRRLQTAGRGLLLRLAGPCWLGVGLRICGRWSLLHGVSEVAVGGLRGSQTRHNADAERW